MILESCKTDIFTTTKTINQSINEMDSQQQLATYLMEKYPILEDGGKKLYDYFDVDFSSFILNCICELQTDETGIYYVITIESPNIRGSHGYSYSLYHKTFTPKNRMKGYFTEIMGMLEWVKDILNNIVYDNIQGMLIDPRKDISGTRILEVNKNRLSYYGNRVIDDIDECYMCYENTVTKTVCGHYICLQCAAHIKKDEVEYIRKCPLCRDELLIL